MVVFGGFVDHGIEPLFAFITMPDSVIGGEVGGGLVPKGGG